MHILITLATAVIFGLFILAGIIGAFTSSRDDRKRTNVNVYVPPAPRYQPPAARQSDDWVAYAQRNPKVKLQVVETMTVTEGQFVREKHMRMSGPVPEARPPCMFPAARQHRNGVRVS